MHGWPIVEVLRGDVAHRHAFSNGLALESLNVARNALDFVLEQLLYTNPVAAPVWIAGLLAPFSLAALRDLRFVTIAYVVIFVVAVALAAKGYYIVGIYAPLLAIGATAIERAAASVRITIFALLATVGILALPLSLPVLPVNGADRLQQGARHNRTQRHAAASHPARLCGGVRLATAGA